MKPRLLYVFNPMCLFVLLLLMFFSGSVMSMVKLPAIFGNNMVLQQESEVPLWGEAEKNTRIAIITSWDHKRYTVNADPSGNWKVSVHTPSAGGAYSITFDDGEELKISNVLIGEVWICSGQSNMAMPVKGYPNLPVFHSNDILMHADNPQIRLFHVQKNSSDIPLHNCKGEWTESNAETVSDFSAVGYLYASILQKELKVPVGIIEAAYGGTVIEAWMDKNALRRFPKMKVNPDLYIPLINGNPSCLFNAMISPLVGFGIRGMIWYQGAQNWRNPSPYKDLMIAMVAGWRNLWERGNWPFYYVQVAPGHYPDHTDSLPYLREAQAEAMKDIPNSGMAVTLDIGSNSTVHPPDKLTVSKRLAYWALANTYHRDGLAYCGPVFKGMTIKEDKVTVTFDHASNGLTSFGRPLSCFEVAGDDKIFYPAVASITSKGVLVQSAHVKHPVAVRYGFKAWVKGDLYNTYGLPASSFRSDNW